MISALKQDNNFAVIFWFCFWFDNDRFDNDFELGLIESWVYKMMFFGVWFLLYRKLGTQKNSKMHAWLSITSDHYRIIKTVHSGPHLLRPCLCWRMEQCSWPFQQNTHPRSLVPLSKIFSAPPISRHNTAFLMYSWPWIEGASDFARMLNMSCSITKEWPTFVWTTLVAK